MDLLEEMAVFAEVARQGSFVAAARKLDKSQPTITRRMQEFQQRYAVELIKRRPGGCHLTPEGEAVYRRVVPILQSIQECLDTGAAIDGFAGVPLTVRCPAGMDSGLLDPWIGEFRRANGELEIQFVTEEPNAPSSEVAADVTIGFSSPAAPGVTRTFGMEETVFVAAPELATRLRQPDTFEGFAQHGFLWLPFQAADAGWVVSRRSDHWQAVDLKPLGSGDSVGFVIEVVLKGVGVGILPTWLIQSRLRTRELVRVFPKWNVKARGNARYLRAYVHPPVLPGSVAVRFLSFVKSCSDRAAEAATDAKRDAKMLRSGGREGGTAT